MGEYEVPLSDREFAEIIRKCEALPEDEQISFLNQRMKEVRKAGRLPSKERVHLLDKYLKEIEIRKRIVALKSENGEKQNGLREKGRIQKIRWIDDDETLIALLELLCVARFIHSDTCGHVPSCITNCFRNQENDDFSNDAIRQRKTRLHDFDSNLPQILIKIQEKIRKAAEKLQESHEEALSKGVKAQNRDIP